jgi:hypothetical protein
MWLLRTLPNNVLGHIGIKHGLKGANACITNHSCGGTLAVIEAFEALRNGESRPRGCRRARNADRAADGAVLPAARPPRLPRCCGRSMRATTAGLFGEARAR